MRKITVRFNDESGWDFELPKRSQLWQMYDVNRVGDREIVRGAAGVVANDTRLALIDAALNSSGGATVIGIRED